MCNPLSGRELRVPSACPNVSGSIFETDSSPGELDSAEDAEDRDPVRIVAQGEAARVRVEMDLEDAVEFLEELDESLGRMVLDAV